jgi:type II restriction enzyme
MNAPISPTPKWILYKHTSNFDIVKQTAIELKGASSATLSNSDRRNLLRRLREAGRYIGRNPDEPLDSIQHRINTLLYYLFGYREPIGKEKRFIFSPLGNLFMKNIEDEANLRKILLTMIWGKQFPDPFFGTPTNFHIYPFRLIFKLLSDERIIHLTPLDYAHCIARIEEIDKVNYEKLVLDILEFRDLNINQVKEIFTRNTHHYVNAFHEWEYTTRLFDSFGLVAKSEGEKVFQLLHGKTTKRWVNNGLTVIHPQVKAFCGVLLDAHPYWETPVEVNDAERLRVDAVKEIYSFCPPELLIELNLTESSIEYRLANLPKLINKFALNADEGAPDEFEIQLTNAMNLFIDVEASRLSGPGNTDIECLYLAINKKFAVEAKSTQNKLTALNSGRLELHRSKISADYTIVVTPRYSPSVLTDIRNTRNVIVLVSTFTEYLYNSLANDAREMSYEDIHQIALSSLGGDMSVKLSHLTLSKYSVKEKEMVGVND